MESKFKFTNPRIQDLKFCINKNWGKTPAIEIQNSMSLQKEKNDSENSALVELRLEIGECEGNVPFFVDITIVSVFKWDDDITDPNKYLDINAPALLLSYARPIIASITAYSGLPAYHIPFINFNEIE